MENSEAKAAELVQIVRSWLAAHGRVLLPDDLKDLKYDVLEKDLCEALGTDALPVRVTPKFLSTIRMYGPVDESIKIEAGVVGNVLLINNMTIPAKLRISTEHDDGDEHG